ncbi:hypothetical protein FHT86_003511 [Rhizobium sp. BK313]|uniref:Terminase small subunit n=1 Tax=Rhizobium sp. BK313 TaxID=2587081 RepID=UPI0017EDF594|nr:Terminase small subunit [Rhizobium sp. BK313]MBB3455212.1 hypothetical protein [Rhizobium sp. BK313]
MSELKGQAARRTVKTVESLVEDLDAVIVFARQCKQPGAMVSAIAQQAKLLGLEAPKQLEILHRPALLPTKVLELTEQEWVAQFGAGPGPRPALTEAGKRRTAEKRLNGCARPKPTVAFEPDDDEATAIPTTGVIDLD